MARAVRPTAFGSPDVLALQEVPVPCAAAGQVVVRVRAAGVNPLDWKLYSGSFHAVDDEHGDVAGSAERPPAIGAECAGVVVETGADVESVRVGDEVVVFPATGAYADHVVAPVDAVVRKPHGLGWDAAGALMLAGTTAAHALHAARVVHGDTVVVHGGSGGVGLMAVQLAAAQGVRVVATASARNHDLLRELGAEPVAHGPGLLDRLRAVAPHGVAAAIDTVGTDEALDVSLELVGDPRRVVSIVGSDRRSAAAITRLGYGPGEDAGAAFRASVRDALAEQAASGALRVVIAATFPLERAADAHRLGLAGHRAGRLVLLP